MITQPDGTDAAPTCPPIGAPGPIPGGFFADCDPSANFEGTLPKAAIFNELILNLHALLAWAGVAPNKGDPTMIWRCLYQAIQTHVPPIIWNMVPPMIYDGIMYYVPPMIVDAIFHYVPPMIPVIPPERIIADYRVLNVVQGGNPNPGNPLGGEAFDSLWSALAWLGWYRITPTGYVVINIGPGVWNHTGTIEVIHPDGAHITIQGAGSQATTLFFPPGVTGLYIPGVLNVLSGMQVLSNAGSATGGDGVLIRGAVTVGDLLVQNFGGYGVNVADNGSCRVQGYMTINGCWYSGLYVFMGGQVTGDFVTLNNNGRRGLFFDANLFAQTVGIVWLQQTLTLGGIKGIMLSGTATEMRANRIGVGACANANAVEVNDGAMLIAAGGNQGDWWTWDQGANRAQYFFANLYAMIRADNLFAPANRSNSSPAVNSQGNLYSYIYAS